MAPDRSAACQLRLDQLREVDAEAREWLYQVVLAFREEELISIGSDGLRFTHMPGFQTTAVPCEELWRGLQLFGKVQEIPQRETTPFSPRSPYGAARTIQHGPPRDSRSRAGAEAGRPSR